MSVQITTAMVEQYKANVMMLAQQRGTRLRGAIREESQTGESAFYEQIGQVEARRAPSRHADTPRMDTPHSRRRVTLESYDWADLIDRHDKVRMLIDPTSSYAMAASWAFGRAIDDAIITAAIGTAYTGKTGTTAVVLPSTQKIVEGNTNLSIAKLIAAKSLFGQADVDPDLQLHICVSQSQIDALLAIEQVTSADYANVKALVEGKVDTFMGFKFHRSQRLAVASDIRSCFAWVEDGILLAVGANPTARISERADKKYSTQVYMDMDIGATRMEEVKVVQIDCDETPD
jgi:hypothetical protein